MDGLILLLLVFLGVITGVRVGFLLLFSRYGLIYTWIAVIALLLIGLHK